MTEYFTIESQEGERIDRYLSEELEDKSRSYIQKLIRDGHVLVDGKTVKAGYRLVAGDNIAITLPEIKEPEIPAENIPLDILYEDKDLLVVNKPKQMVVHPAPGHYTGTLVNALMYKYLSCSSYADYVLASFEAIRWKTNTSRVERAISKVKNAIANEAAGFPYAALSEIEDVFPGV